MKSNQLLKEWLSDFKSDNSDYSGFYAKYFGNKKFYQKLSNALENKVEIEPLCCQIYKLAQAKNAKLNHMVLDFLPVILENYLVLSLTISKDNKNIDSSLVLIRTCLLSIYNLLKPKILDDFDKEKPLFFIPSFTDGSVFHFPVGRPDLDFLNYSLTVPQTITTVLNDKQLIPGLIKIYNRQLADYSLISFENYCNLILRISSLKTKPRIDVTSETLNELSNGICFLLFKQDHVDMATKALKNIEIRANYEIMTSVMLTVSAIYSSFSVDSSDYPIGLKTIIKPRAKTLTNENVITNANFRPEKVSEDLVHLLDINQNNPINIPVKSNSVPHNQGFKVDHFTLDSADIAVQFKSPTNNFNLKSVHKIKSSLKSDKSHNQIGENKIFESEGQL